jgi:hypothetical protein
VTLSRALRPLVAVTLAAGVLGAGGALAAPKLGPNLVVNPGFEQSSNDAATANGIPVLPVGWTVEGATILFDYNQRAGHTGKRNVAISGSLAPGKQVCDASAALATGGYTCVPNPAAAGTGAANDGSMAVFSVRPFWVTEKAIPVAAGKKYRFSMYSIRPSLDPNAGVPGEGAATKVRWVDASGSTIKVADGPVALKGAKRELGFRLSSLDLVAPAGAVGAKLLLGHSDYTVTSAQVAFDDIAFQKVG